MSPDLAAAGRLHFELVHGLVEKGVVPSNGELCARLACTPTQLDAHFETLAAEHGVVLHPNSHQVWAIHPFSLAPTPFLVQAGDRRWWGNCVWCALGIATLVGEPCTITTTLGAEEERAVLTIDGGRVHPENLVVHFPIPMTRAWDNVVYTCSTMLLFRDAAHVREWSARHVIPVGDIQPVATVWAFSRLWYGGHLDPCWRKKSADEARAIFAAMGFTHPVWDLGAMQGRF